MGIPEVTVDDVANRYDGNLLADFTEAYISTQIQDAVDFASSRWRAQIEMRLATGYLTDNLYKRVISDAVLRVARNPGGLASENEGGYGYSTRANVASGYLGFTQDDIDTLCGVIGPTVPGYFHVGLDHGWS